MPCEMAYSKSAGLRSRSSEFSSVSTGTATHARCVFRPSRKTHARCGREGCRVGNLDGAVRCWQELCRAGGGWCRRWQGLLSAGRTHHPRDYSRSLERIFIVLQCADFTTPGNRSGRKPAVPEGVLITLRSTQRFPPVHPAAAVRNGITTA
jgi:hypothetical protein